jgi:ferredoxin-NADP reductase
MIASAVTGEPRAVSTIYGSPSGSQNKLPGERKLRVREVRRETALALSLVFERPADLEFVAGQFLTLVFHIGGADVRRSYSISSSPHDRSKLVVTVKKIENGLVSSWIHEHVRAGTSLRVRGPSGNFVFEPGQSRELLLIGGGSGITPLMSILRVALDETIDTRVALLFANSSDAEIIFAGELEQLASRVGDRLTITHVVEAPGVVRSVRGRIDQRVLSEAIATIGANAQVHLCGPSAMMESVIADLNALGIDPSQVHVERFASVRSATTTQSTTPRRLDVMGANALISPGQTVLEGASDAGISLDFSCTMGGCGACKVRLAAGEVVHDEPNCLTQQERDAGMILACVARPLSDIAIERLS